MSSFVDILIQLLPLLLVFPLGILLRICGVMSRENGDTVLRLVFYAPIPALTLLAVSQIELQRELLYLPCLAWLITAICCLAAILAAQRLKISRPEAGAFVLAVMIMNVSYILPFVNAVYGAVGVALIVIFDFGNALLVFTFCHYLAFSYGGEEGSNGALRKLLANVPLWSLIVGLLLNLCSVQLTGTVHQFLQIVGDMTNPLIMLALGILCAPKIHHLKRVSIGVLIRMGLGLVVGLALCQVVGLSGLSRMVVVLCAAAPCGFMSLIYSSLAGLDRELSASMVSCSILLGMFCIPLLMALLA